MLMPTLDGAKGKDSLDSLPLEAVDKEAVIKRNPYEDFVAVQTSRADYDPSNEWRLSKAPNTSWRVGGGASDDRWKEHELIAIDPQEPGRSTVANYKLLISTTVPRPIALVSTRTADGKTCNLAPVSYFQNVASDPPLYSLSLTGRQENDTLRNILATEELCISMTSDWLIEAANMASVNTPPHISEWELAGLTPLEADKVSCPYVAEAAFSVECKLHSKQDFFSKRTGEKSGTLVLVEAVKFHIWKDAVDKDKATADLLKLRPIFRAGGITYGCCFDGFEIPRPETFRLMRENPEVQEILQNAGQAIPEANNIQ